MAAVWCGESMDPNSLMPPHLRPDPPPPRELTEEELNSENRIAWAAIARAFGGW
jgi:hypothetical protein